LEIVGLHRGSDSATVCRSLLTAVTINFAVIRSKMELLINTPT
jgi:hypothetical protein